MEAPKGIVRRRKRSGYLFWKISVPVAFLALWEIAVAVGWVDAFWLSRPLALIHQLTDWTASGALLSDLAATLGPAMTGFLLGAATGVIVALGLHKMPRTDRVLAPYIDFGFAVPKPALIPVLLFVFGLGATPRVILVALLVFFVFYHNARASLADGRPALSSQLLIMGASRRDVNRYVTVPAMAPYIISAARIGAPLALVGTVFAEFFASTEGMGNVIQFATAQLDSTSMLTAILVLTLVGVVVDSTLRYLADRVAEWQ